jgi:hypothetical protein
MRFLCIYQNDCRKALVNNKIEAITERLEEQNGIQQS